MKTAAWTVSLSLFRHLVYAINRFLRRCFKFT